MNGFPFSDFLPANDVPKDVLQLLLNMPAGKTTIKIPMVGVPENALIGYLQDQAWAKLAKEALSILDIESVDAVIDNRPPVGIGIEINIKKRRGDEVKNTLSRENQPRLFGGRPVEKAYELLGLLLELPGIKATWEVVYALMFVGAAIVLGALMVATMFGVLPIAAFYFLVGLHNWNYLALLAPIGWATPTIASLIFGFRYAYDLRMIPTRNLKGKPVVYFQYPNFLNRPLFAAYRNDVFNGRIAREAFDEWWWNRKEDLRRLTDWMILHDPIEPILDLFFVTFSLEHRESAATQTCGCFGYSRPARWLARWLTRGDELLERIGRVPREYVVEPIFEYLRDVVLVFGALVTFVNLPWQYLFWYVGFGPDTVTFYLLPVFWGWGIWAVTHFVFGLIFAHRLELVPGYTYTILGVFRKIDGHPQMNEVPGVGVIVAGIEFGKWLRKLGASFNDWTYDIHFEFSEWVRRTKRNWELTWRAMSNQDFREKLAANKSALELGYARTTILTAKSTLFMERLLEPTGLSQFWRIITSEEEFENALEPEKIPVWPNGIAIAVRLLIELPGMIIGIIRIMISDFRSIR